MSFLRFVVRRPVLVLMIFGALVLFGAYEYSSWLAFVAAFGVILGAAYMLYLYRRVIFGKLEKADLKDMV